MIAWLRQNFPASKNYFVHQNEKEQINSFLLDHIVAPFQKGRKHNLWGEIAEKLPGIGKKLGWVPNKIPGTFLTDTVENEIADAFAAADLFLKPLPHHFEKSRELLNHFNLLHLSQQRPLYLSQGEMKIIWFLLQWAKKPEYLIIGYLPAGLSQTRMQDVIKFLFENTGLSDSTPSIILGFQRGQTEWCNELFSNENWKILSRWPEYNSVMR